MFSGRGSLSLLSLFSVPVFYLPRHAANIFLLDSEPFPSCFIYPEDTGTFLTLSLAFPASYRLGRNRMHKSGSIGESLSLAELFSGVMVWFIDSYNYK